MIDTFDNLSNKRLKWLLCKCLPSPMFLLKMELKMPIDKFQRLEEKGNFLPVTRNYRPALELITAIG
jgi:hypothetical protein